jgi:hypothetical protein
MLQAFSGDGRDHAGARKLDLPSRFIAPLKSDEVVTGLAARSRSSKIPMEVKSLEPANLYFRGGFTLVNLLSSRRHSSPLTELVQIKPKAGGISVYSGHLPRLLSFGFQLKKMPAPQKLLR